MPATEGLIFVAQLVKQPIMSAPYWKNVHGLAALISAKLGVEGLGRTPWPTFTDFPCGLTPALMRPQVRRLWETPRAFTEHVLPEDRQLCSRYYAGPWTQWHADNFPPSTSKANSDSKAPSAWVSHCRPASLPLPTECPHHPGCAQGIPTNGNISTI